MISTARPIDRIRGLRIAHLIETDGPGGAERVLSLIAAACQAGGTSNVAFLPEGKEGWLSRELTGVGVTVEHFRLEHPLSPGLLSWLVTRFRRHRIDVAHSHEFSMAFYGAVAARLAAVPHAITMHGGRYYAERSRRRWALRAAARMSDHLVSVSDPLRTSLASELRLPRDRIRFIPNGVPEPSWSASTLRDELGLAAESRLAIAVGNLYPVKGHEYLIRALGLLAPSVPDLHLAIAGRGALQESLQELADSLGVGGRLHLLGLRDDIPEVLGAGDLFVMPSLSEGLPMALLEAMFAGLPAVATKVGQIPETLEHGRCGLLVPPGDPGALTEAMRRILTDPGSAEAMAVRARRRAETSYSVRTMVERYVELYAGMAPPNGGRRGRQKLAKRSSTSSTGELAPPASAQRGRSPIPFSHPHRRSPCPS